MRYPYSRPDISEADVKLALEVLQSQFLTQGPFVEKLEEALKSTFNVKYAVVCNSGTAALHMAYFGIGLGPAKGLITSPVTFLATANAARMCDAPVGFADVDPTTGNMTLSSIKDAVASSPFNVGAIALVHLGGRPCDDIAEIRDFCHLNKIFLIEDACHAPKATYVDGVGRKFIVGACEHSDAATMSFHAIKHIAAGEGGVLLTNNQDIAFKAARFRSHGIIRNPSEMNDNRCADDPWYYEMSELGFNYRLSEINCAIALGQVARLEENINRRQEIAQKYYSELGNIRHVDLPKTTDGSDIRHSWHLFSLSIDFGAIRKSRKEVMQELAMKGIGSQVHYIPLYRQPYYRADKYKTEFRGAESYYEKCISIPMFFGLSDEDVSFISENIRSVISE